MGARLAEGRWFDAAGRDGRRRIAVVNASLAESLFPLTGAVGKHIVLDDRRWEVIGVIGDMRSRGLHRRPRAEVYVPASRADETGAVVAMRTPSSPADVLPAVRVAVQRVDNGLALADIATMQRRVNDSIAAQRFHATLLGVLAAFALLLAATGIYGLVAHSVSQRTREIGIRKALGEGTSTIFRRVLTWVLSLSVIGLVLGALLAMAGIEWLTDTVTDAREPGAAIFLQVPVLLLFVTLLAAWIPALRAGRVDPMIAMRE
jgi:predicted lysophospholipase L1 biosynthesis ABC-type transport system permease subunit